MLIRPVKERELDFRLSGFQASSDGQLFVLCGGTGQVLVTRRDFTPRFEYSTDSLITCWDMSPDGALLAVSNGKTLSILRLDGHLIYEEKAEAPSAGDFDNLLFSANQKALWAVRHIGNEQVELQVRETAGWQVVRRAVLDEPAPPTAFFLYEHPEKQALAIWAGAGQDGQWMYWVYDNGKELHVFQVPQLTFTGPPSFHPAGGEFLIVQGDGNEELRRYTFPQCELIDRMQWSGEYKLDRIGFHPCYLSN